MTSAQEPLLTIVIPTYNYGEFIGRQLNSLTRQINNDIEVVIVDDGSTDDTKAIVEQFLSYNLHYYWKPNGGVASARNFGIERSIGQYFIFINSDDEFFPDSIKKIITSIKKNPEGKFFIGQYEAIWTDKKKVRLVKPKLSADRKNNLVNFLLKNNLHVPNGSYVVHKDELQVGFPENLTVGEDTPVIAQLLSHCDPIMLQFPIARIYKHSNSLRKNFKVASEMSLKTVIEIFDTPRISREHIFLRNAYLSRKLLSLTRYHFKLNNIQECRESYKLAIKYSPFSIFRIKYFLIYLKSFKKP